MINKDFKGFRVDETSMNGLFSLCSPTFVDEPYRVDQGRQVKYYAISKDDNPNYTLLLAYMDIEKILKRELSEMEDSDWGRNWSIYIRFHLFDAVDKFTKTPRYATLEIILGDLEIRQHMFTRNSSERFTYSVNDIDELEDAFKSNIGWDRDRMYRRIDAEREENENQ